MLRRLVLFPILCIAISCSENAEQKSVQQTDSPVKKETVSPLKEKPAPDSAEIYRMKLSELQKEGEIVIDSANNLAWMRKDFSYLNNRFAKNWNEAMSWADSMNAQNYLGFSDWYVPSIKEYKTMNRNSGDRKVYREKFLEIEKDHSWGKGAYAFWASNEKGKYVASYISFHDGFATSGDKSEQRNAITGEDFGMSVRLVRRVWR